MTEKLYPIADGVTLYIFAVDSGRDIRAELRGIGTGGETFLLSLVASDLKRLGDALSDWGYCVKEKEL